MYSGTPGPFTQICASRTVVEHHLAAWSPSSSMVRYGRVEAFSRGISASSCRHPPCSGLGRPFCRHFCEQKESVIPRCLGVDVGVKVSKPESRHVPSDGRKWTNAIAPSSCACESCGDACIWLRYCTLMKSRYASAQRGNDPSWMIGGDPSADHEPDPPASESLHACQHDPTQPHRGHRSAVCLTSTTSRNAGVGGRHQCHGHCAGTTAITSRHSARNL
ncbi:hypothetical protein FB567DRAFT_7580 [Paraphoma chrysanthemicola]|uniref:Uncharacterized protein n=1 Tax=Paraphoma chrysanthemicola TaxID=798071 RepID=A0A8K0RHJ4_9PLEO|nr:hypothetical protein FB567DRAFT_7580 [Paraphoma chrysanthemicola]